MSRRQWMSHRQAYFPRMWANLLAALAIGAVVMGALSLAGVRSDSGLGGMAIGAAVGTVVAVVYWRVMIGRWRRKHPVLEPQEIVDRKQQAARWN